MTVEPASNIQHPSPEEIIRFFGLDHVPTPGNRPRVCGACSMCCTALGITELGKPTWTRCRHQNHHRPGCRRYDRRPTECRTWRCGWLDGFLGEEARPDKLGVLVSVMTTDKHGILSVGGKLVWWLQCEPEPAPLAIAALIQQAQRVPVVEIWPHGQEPRCYGTREAIAEFMWRYPELCRTDAE